MNKVTLSLGARRLGLVSDFSIFRSSRGRGEHYLLGEKDDDIYELLKSGVKSTAFVCCSPEGYVVCIEPKGEKRHSLEENGNRPEGEVEQQG